MLGEEDLAKIKMAEDHLERFRKSPNTDLLRQLFQDWKSLSQIEYPIPGFHFDDCTQERIKRTMEKLAELILKNAQEIVF